MIWSIYHILVCFFFFTISIFSLNSQNSSYMKSSRFELMIFVCTVGIWIPDQSAVRYWNCVAPSGFEWTSPIPVIQFMNYFWDFGPDFKQSLKNRPCWVWVLNFIQFPDRNLDKQYEDPSEAPPKYSYLATKVAFIFVAKMLHIQSPFLIVCFAHKFTTIWIKLWKNIFKTKN